MSAKERPFRALAKAYPILAKGLTIVSCCRTMRTGDKVEFRQIGKKSDGLFEYRCAGGCKGELDKCR